MLSFEKIVFGPIKSRRLGRSLGINLLPMHDKLCNYDCIYCECGWTNTPSNVQRTLPSVDEVTSALLEKINILQSNNESFDSITFSGNGEPTLHPQFLSIINNVIAIRNQYAPDAAITVITNAANLDNENIVDALKKIDNPLIKLDAGTAQTFAIINRAEKHLHFEDIVNNIIKFNSNAIIQTMLIRGKINGIMFDNTTPAEIEKYIELIKKINPKSIMLYTIDRETPMRELEKINNNELLKIAQLLTQNTNINVSVY